MAQGFNSHAVVDRNAILAKDEVIQRNTANSEEVLTNSKATFS
jgi:hypothetical protein